MTYENWCKYSSDIIKEAKKHNDWADKAKHFLLTNLGPRIEKLRRSGYMGCGFHYDMEQNFGKLIIGMSISWQPSANWCANVESDRDKKMLLEIIYKLLLESVRKAEKSTKKYKSIFNK